MGKLDARDIETTTFRYAGGVSPVERWVRMVHIPTGIVVEEDSKATHWANREAAYRKLKEKVNEYSRRNSP